MPTDRLEALLAARLDDLSRAGSRKGAEMVIREVLPAEGERGPRYLLEGSEVPFLRMNSNGYLGLASHPQVVAAEERAAERFGAGPQAVRFISGTFEPHLGLEARLAEFHGREAAMLYSSAYAAVMGVLPPLITPDTVVLSDELNHNCIINGIRLARPARCIVTPHLDTDAVEAALREISGSCRRVLIVTDGVFSMRGDCAALDLIVELAGRYDEHFEENVMVILDDSHGVGTLGSTGRGTEEHMGARADLLVATLGKALGVNGGYAAGPATTIEYLRETSPFYVYSNPITPGEAVAARVALDILDGPSGRERLGRLRAMTERFETGLVRLGFEVLRGPHPVVPLLVRDTARTTALVGHLHRCGVLATGLAYPVVPRGEEEIRFQISAEHTPADIDAALGVLGDFEDCD
jgi:glycine C-acetyltransferase